MAEKFIIKGGRPLEGEIEVRGAKNAAFPIIASTLLTNETCEISNVPKIEDVFRMVEILKSMGAEVEWIGERTLKINTTNIDPLKVREDLVGWLRGSVLFMGPLLARFHKISFPPPGGCVIGARPIDTHLDAFSQLGVNVSKDQMKYVLELKGPLGKETILNEISVTATENLMIFASLRPGRTIIKSADQDYQVQELVKFLRAMGVAINTIAPHTLEIIGSEKLKGVKHELMYDPIEAGTFIVAAAASRGEVMVKNVELDFLDLEIKKLKDFGIPLKISGKTVSVGVWQNLKVKKIQSLPYPGFHSDLLSVFGVLATQAQGTTLIHDPLYEGRLKYLEEINKMGAEIYFADPHRAIINGPTKLYGNELGSFDLRGGAALIIAGLIAQGETAVSNIYQIDRGYEKIEERLQRIGADIKRITI